MDDDLTEYPTQRVRLIPCQSCGRKFNPDALNKHQAICRKVSRKQRKVFDAGRQRATDSDVPYKATRKTAQIYNGEAPAQDSRVKKPNWREKHRQLVQSIREARGVTVAMKKGGPLPAFRPSEVPSDYVNCPYCHRNFNQHAGERHIPFCQAKQGQRQMKNNSRLNQQLDRGRSLPPQQQQQQHSSQYRQQQQHSAQYQQQQHSAQYRQQQQQQSYNQNGYSNSSHDIYNNGYKHSNSAPMIVRRNPNDYQQPPPPPLPRNTSDGSGWGFRKLFGLGSKQQTNSYAPDDEDYYEQPARRPVQHQQPVLMRTGRTQENTNLNVRARQRTDEGSAGYGRRIPPPQQAPQSYGRTQYQYSNNQSNSMRPTAIARPPVSTTIRCGDCGSVYSNNLARYCPQCGSRR